jgi:hypothetical protein
MNKKTLSIIVSLVVLGFVADFLMEKISGKQKFDELLESVGLFQAAGVITLT